MPSLRHNRNESIGTLKSHRLPLPPPQLLWPVAPGAERWEKKERTLDSPARDIGTEEAEAMEMDALGGRRV